VNNRKRLKRGAIHLGIDLADKQLDLLMLYCVELQKWSKRINLIARETSDEMIIENHFIDSLSLLLMLKDHHGSLLDVGTGAGFPGMVLAAVQPERPVVLLEPRKKRVSFLHHIKRTLGLSNVEIIDARLEECLANDKVAAAQYVTSRAVAAPEIFLPMVASLVENGAEVILMLAKKEPVVALSSINDSWQQSATMSFTLPFSHASRVLAKVTAGNRE
jgi:16S rRNA (guanine527-N7)-methyltransferase